MTSRSGVFWVGPLAQTPSEYHSGFRCEFLVRPRPDPSEYHSGFFRDMTSEKIDPKNHQNPPTNSVEKSIENPLRNSLRNPLRNSLRYSLQASVGIQGASHTLVAVVLLRCCPALEAGSTARKEIAKPMTSLQRLADTCVEHGLELVRLYKGFLVKLRELIFLFATASVTLLQVQVQSLRHYVNHLSGARCFGQCDPRRRGEP